MRSQITDLVDSGLRLGKGYLMGTWDKELFMGLGDMKIRSVPTRSIFLEPGKVDEDDWNYVVQVQKMDFLSFMRKFPEQKENISNYFRMGKTASMKIPPGVASPVATGNEPAKGGVPSSPSGTNFFELMKDLKDHKEEFAELVSIWVRDDEMVEEVKEIIDLEKTKKKDEIVRAKKKVMVKANPTGRFYQLVGNVLLTDEKNKLPGFPFHQYWNYKIGEQQYGETELRHTVPIQNQYDVRNNQLYDLMNFNLAPIRYVGAGANLDTKKLVNKPGLIVPVADVSQIFTESPPRIGDASFSSLEKIRGELETVYGVREVSQGTIPGDIRSGTAIEALQEAADVRLRGKSREIESAVTSLTKFAIAIVNKFYIMGVHWRPKNRPIKDVGPNGEEKETMLFDTKEWEMVEKNIITHDMFNVTVQAGVNRPRSRLSQQQLVQWLTEQKITDKRYIVEHSQLDGKDELIKRMGPIWQLELDLEIARLEAEISVAKNPQPQQGVA